MEYELYNPSDPYTFLAADRETAALAVACLSNAFGADTQDGREENHIPIFIFGGFDQWFKETFGRTPDEGLEARKKEVGEALLSLMLGHFEDRRRYDAALRAIDDPEKREQFIADWQSGLSSMNNIGEKAHRIGKKLVEAAEEGEK